MVLERKKPRRNSGAFCISTDRSKSVLRNDRRPAERVVDSPAEDLIAEAQYLLRRYLLDSPDANRPEIADLFHPA
jgi:hypothetical protein